MLRKHAQTVSNTDSESAQKTGPERDDRTTLTYLGRRRRGPCSTKIDCTLSESEGSFETAKHVRGILRAESK